MSLKKISKNQPDIFEFNKTSLELAKRIISNYPEGKQQSAVMAFLYLAQRQNNNWIPLSAMKYIAKFLDMPYTTTPCMLRGAYKLVNVCKNKISKNENELTPDSKISWMEVECLGACVNAPMIQINDEYFEDLDEKKLETIIENIKKGQKIQPGSFRGRKSSEPEKNRITLMDSKNA